MRGGTACLSPISPNARHAAARTSLSSIPQGLDEGGHRLSIAYRTQRPTRRNTNIPIPIPQGLDEMGYSGSAYLHQRLTRRSTNIPIPIPQGLDEWGHRLSIAYRTQRPTRRTHEHPHTQSPKAWMRGGTACLSPIAPNARHAALTNMLNPNPLKAWMRGGTACLSPIFTQRPTRRTHEHYSFPIPQGLDEVGHRLSIAYRTQRPTRRSTNTPIPIPQGLDERGDGLRVAYLTQRYLTQRHAATRTSQFPSPKAWMRWGTAGAPIFTNASHAAARTFSSSSPKAWMRGARQAYPIPPPLRAPPHAATP
jgi:hypothetical protein